MTPSRRYSLVVVALFAVTLAHALATWPPRATVALYAGGVAIAFAAEAAVVRAGLLRHGLAPRIAGVPVAVLLAWPSAVYVALRLALLVAPAGPAAAALAAVLATLGDLLVDPRGVEAGAWRYPDAPVSEPRFRGVPWWNFVGWLVVVFVAATLPAPFV